MDNIKVTKDFISLIDGLPEILKKINEDMSAADKRVSSMYHTIENMTHIDKDLAVCYLRELQSALKERRKAKAKHLLMCNIKSHKDDFEGVKALACDLIKIMEAS